MSILTQTNQPRAIPPPNRFHNFQAWSFRRVKQQNYFHDSESLLRQNPEQTKRKTQNQQEENPSSQTPPLPAKVVIQGRRGATAVATNVAAAIAADTTVKKIGGLPLSPVLPTRRTLLAPLRLVTQFPSPEEPRQHERAAKQPDRVLLSPRLEAVGGSFGRGRRVWRKVGVEAEVGGRGVDEGDEDEGDGGDLGSWGSGVATLVDGSGACSSGSFGSEETSVDSDSDSDGDGESESESQSDDDGELGPDYADGSLVCEMIAEELASGRERLRHEEGVF
ncbi:hypothetical protein MBLNU230_g7529t1 [Neophaeotheca triangularis]